MDSDGPAAKFITATKNLTPAQREQALLTASSTDSDNLYDVYKHVVCGSPDNQQSKTENKSKCWRHVAIIRHHGTLYELDPLKSRPVAHGASFAATFAQDAARVCEEILISANPATCSNHWKYSFFGLLVRDASDDDLIYAAFGVDGVSSVVHDGGEETNQKEGEVQTGDSDLMHF